MILGYMRVSTLRQASEVKTSLEEQEKSIRRWVAGHIDEQEVKMFIERGVNGSTPLERRPQGIAMLAQLKDGDTIISAKMTRLFRSTSDALVSVEKFHKDGVKVVLLDIGGEPVAESATGKLFFTIMAAAAEFDKERILEQMQDGRNAKLAKGGFVGGLAPYGWRTVGRGTGAILVEHENEQRVVRLISDLSAQGDTSLRRVSAELDRRGLANRQGKKFAPEQIRRIRDRSVTKIAAE